MLNWITNSACYVEVVDFSKVGSKCSRRAKNDGTDNKGPPLQILAIWLSSLSVAHFIGQWWQNGTWWQEWDPCYGCKMHRRWDSLDGMMVMYRKGSMGHDMPSLDDHASWKLEKWLGVMREIIKMEGRGQGTHPIKTDLNGAMGEQKNLKVLKEYDTSVTEPEIRCRTVNFSNKNWSKVQH